MVQHKNILLLQCSSCLEYEANVHENSKGVFKLILETRLALLDSEPYYALHRSRRAHSKHCGRVLTGRFGGLIRKLSRFQKIPLRL